MVQSLIAAPPRIVLAGTYPFKAGERHGSWWSASQHVVVGLDGDGVLEVNGQRQPLPAGTAAALPWGATVAFVAGPRRGFSIASVHLVCVPWAAEDPGFPEHGPPDRPPPAPPHGACPLPRRGIPGDGSRRLAEQALAICDRWSEPSSPLRTLALRGAALQFVAALHEAGRDQRRHPQAGPVRDLLHWLRFNFRQPITRTELARRTGLGQTALGAAFKAVTGRSPTAYLIQLRLDEARRLLRTTSLPVAKVAALVGMDDPAYFSRMFSRRFGTAPRQAR